MASSIVYNKYTNEKSTKMKKNFFDKIIDLYKEVSSKVFSYNKGIYALGKYFKSYYKGYIYDSEYLDEIL